MKRKSVFKTAILLVAAMLAQLLPMAFVQAESSISWEVEENFDTYETVTSASGFNGITFQNFKSVSGLSIADGVGNKKKGDKSLLMVHDQEASAVRVMTNSKNGYGNPGFTHYSAEIMVNGTYADKKIYITWAGQRDNFLTFKKDGTLELPDTSLDAAQGVSLNYSPYKMYRLDYIADFTTKIRYVYLNGTLIGSGEFASVKDVDISKSVSIGNLCFDLSKNDSIIVDSIKRQYFKKNAITLNDVQARVLPYENDSAQMRFDAWVENNSGSGNPVKISDYKLSDGTVITKFTSVDGIGEKSEGDKSLFIDVQKGTYATTSSSANWYGRPIFSATLEGTAFDAPDYGKGDRALASFKLYPGKNYNYSVFNLDINKDNSGREFSARLESTGIKIGNTTVSGFEGFNEEKWYSVDFLFTNNAEDENGSTYDIYVDGKLVYSGTTKFVNRLTDFQLIYYTNKTVDSASGYMTVPENNGVYFDDITIGKLRASFSGFIPEFTSDSVRCNPGQPGVLSVNKGATASQLTEALASNVYSAQVTDTDGNAVQGDAEAIGSILKINTDGKREISYIIREFNPVIFSYDFDGEIAANEQPFINGYIRKFGTNSNNYTFPHSLSGEKGIGGRRTDDGSLKLASENVSICYDADSNLSGSDTNLSDPFIYLYLPEFTDSKIVAEISVYIGDLNSTRDIQLYKDSTYAETLVNISAFSGDMFSFGRNIGKAEANRWYHFAFEMQKGAKNAAVYLNGEKVSGYYENGIYKSCEDFTVSESLDFNRFRIIHTIPSGEADGNGDRYVIPGCENSVTAIDNFTMYYADSFAKTSPVLTSREYNVSSSVNAIAAIDGAVFADDLSVSGELFKYSREAGSYSLVDSDGFFIPGDVAVVRTSENMFGYYTITEDMLTGKVTVNNGAVEYEIFNKGNNTVSVITAGYTEDGRLNELISSNSISEPVSGTQTLTCNLAQAAENGYCRIFALKDILSMQPLTAALTLSAAEE